MNEISSQSATAVLNDLIETCKNGQDGFHTAAEDVTNPQLKEVFERFSAQRAKFATELQTFVRSLGKEAETESTVAGALHRGWIDLKSALSSKDEKAILAECERGEDSAVSHYCSALKENLPADIHAIVLLQSGMVQASYDEIKRMRDSAV